MPNTVYSVKAAINGRTAHQIQIVASTWNKPCKFVILDDSLLHAIVPVTISHVSSIVVRLPSIFCEVN